MTSREAHLQRCFSSLFPALSRAQILAASPDTVADWDSLRAVTLISMVEEEFNVEIEPTLWPDLGSFAAILNYLDERALVI